MYTFQGSNINYQSSQHYNDFLLTRLLARKFTCMPHYNTLDQTEKLNTVAQMGHVMDKPVIWDHETY